MIFRVDLFEILLQNLTRWGGVLLELSQFQNGPESKEMVQGRNSGVMLWFDPSFALAVCISCVQKFDLVEFANIVILES